MIASVAAVCDLDLVVVGGGVAKSGSLLFDPLREALTAYAGLDFLARPAGGARPAWAGTRAWSGAAALVRETPFWLIVAAARYSCPVPPKTVGHR